jgi:hypothetical protein
MQKLYIDDTDIYAVYGLVVMEEKGLFSPLVPKHAYKFDWPDEHGLDLSHAVKVVKPRKFQIQLALKATSKAAFRQGIMNFLELFYAPGLRMLRLDDISKVFMVDIDGGKPVQRLTHWNETLMAGFFTVNFIEPEPINRVYYSTGTSVQVSLATDGDELFTIYWGDGTVDTITEITSPVTNATLGSGKYVVIAGRVDRITTLTVSNTTTVTW